MNASRFEALVRKTSNASRLTDAVLVVVFVHFAYTADSPEWIAIWFGSALLCLTTAIFGPVDLIFRFLRERFLKSGVKVAPVAANDTLPANRQQRRALARSKGKPQ